MGKIDTQSLGELTGNEELMNINSDMTKVKQILDMPTEHAVKFVFDIISEIPLSKRIIKSDLIILFITGILTVLLGVISYSLYKPNGQQSSEPAVNVLNPNQDNRRENIDLDTIISRSINVSQRQTNLSGSRGDVENNSLYSVLPRN